MPNWAYGHTDITGTKAAILSFVNRYIFPDEPTTIDGVKYFARSFLHVDREEIKAEIEEAFRGVPQDEEREFRIYPDYAWSASNCVESGYPEHWPDTCITLQDACLEDQVDVSIHTKEEGMWFEEYIWCFRTGEFGSESSDLKTAVCKDCGNTQAIASFEELDDLVCCECSGSNFEMAKEDR